MGNGAVASRPALSSFSSEDQENNSVNRRLSSTHEIMETRLFGDDMKHRKELTRQLGVRFYKNYIFSDFRFIRQIGSGRYSKVHFAESHKLARNNFFNGYAIKEVSVDQMTRHQMSDFRYELNLLSHMSHPNLPRITSVYDAHGSETQVGNHNLPRSLVYVVMEHLSGGELLPALCRQRKYMEIDALRLVRQLVSAVSYLHSQGVVHGSLLPENLVLTQAGSLESSTLRIVDFSRAETEWHHRPSAVVSSDVSHLIELQVPEVLYHYGVQPIQNAPIAQSQSQQQSTAVATASAALTAALSLTATAKTTASNPATAVPVTPAAPSGMLNALNQNIPAISTAPYVSTMPINGSMMNHRHWSVRERMAMDIWCVGALTHLLLSGLLPGEDGGHVIAPRIHSTKERKLSPNSSRHSSISRRFTSLYTMFVPHSSSSSSADLCQNESFVVPDVHDPLEMQTLRPRFLARQWMFVSDEAKDLLHELLLPEPWLRPSLLEVLHIHPWFALEAAAVNNRDTANKQRSSLVAERNERPETIEEHDSELSDAADENDNEEEEEEQFEDNDSEVTIACISQTNLTHSVLPSLRRFVEDRQQKDVQRLFAVPSSPTSVAASFSTASSPFAALLSSKSSNATALSNGSFAQHNHVCEKYESMEPNTTNRRLAASLTLLQAQRRYQVASN